MYKIKDLKGKFKAKAILNSEFVLENKEKMIQEAKNWAKQNKVYDKLVITDSNIRLKGEGSFWLLPKLNKIRCGEITFRSNDFIFSYKDSEGNIHKTYCEKPNKTDLNDKGFNTLNIRNEITNWEISKIL